MYSTNNGQPVSSADIRAMKNADYVQFITSKDGGSRIRANVDSDNSPTGFHEYREFPVDGKVYSYTTYLNDTEKRDATDVDGREGYVSLRKTNNNLQALCTLIKTGDKIELDWSADGRCNQYAAKAGLHVDTLRLRIMRYRKASDSFEQYVELHMDQSICPDNTARMIRINPWG